MRGVWVVGVADAAWGARDVPVRAWGRDAGERGPVWGDGGRSCVLSWDDLRFSEGVLINGNVELVRRFCANQGGCDNAYRACMLGAADAEWCKIDRQGDILVCENSFLYDFHLMRQVRDVFAVVI